MTDFTTDNTLAFHHYDRHLFLSLENILTVILYAFDMFQEAAFRSLTNSEKIHHPNKLKRMASSKTPRFYTIASIFPSKCTAYFPSKSGPAVLAWRMASI
jgi:hypothetical protein